MEQGLRDALDGNGKPRRGPAEGGVLYDDSNQLGMLLRVTDAEQRVDLRRCAFAGDPPALARAGQRLPAVKTELARWNL